MPNFEYGDDATAYLCKKDKRLGALIERVGKIERAVTPDLFEALISSIVAQQISSKAAATVWGRLQERFAITPETLATLPVEDIQSCGMSMRKAGYIQSAAQAVHSGELDVYGLDQLPADAVCAALSALPGIGVWTAEMLMIFSMRRPDVLSWGDLAIRRGIMQLYGHKKLTKEQFERYRKRYSPHGTVASLYLWHLAGGQV